RSEPMHPADQYGPMYRHQESRHPDRCAVHDLSDAAAIGKGQRLLEQHERDALRAAGFAGDEGLRVARIVLRGQPDPGYRRRDERAVRAGGRHRAAYQLNSFGRRLRVGSDPRSFAWLTTYAMTGSRPRPAASLCD